MRSTTKLISKIDKRRLKSRFGWLKLFKLWQLVVLFLVFCSLAAWSLRQNNLKMVELRNEVVAADSAGEGVEESLKKLGDYIVSHMNTNMAGPIDLVNTFNRDYEKLVLQSEELTNAQYLKIREECVTFDVPVEIQSECISSEANKITDNEVDLPSELYSFDFKSPFWSPDFAGIFSLLTVVTGLLIFVKSITQFVVKKILKHHR